MQLPPWLLPDLSENRDSCTMVCSQGLEAVALAAAKGITIVYGSDLLGDLHPYQSQEFVLRSAVQQPLALLQSATINAAKLFQMLGHIGQLKPGMAADLIVLSADPLKDVGVLAEANNIRMVVRDGLVVKGPYPELAAANGLLFPSVGGSS